MRTGFKVAAWAALFLGCAGVGAFVAAHSDPFPPGVDRPSASVALPSSQTPSPGPQPWVASLRSFSYHQLYVGGRCTTRWRGALRFTFGDGGVVEGTGTVHLVGGLACDFPIAQVQAQRVGLTVGGRLSLSNGWLVLALSEASIEPSGAQDFGGFVPMLPARVVLPSHGDSYQARITRRKTDDEGRGVYVWSADISAAPVSS